MSFAWMVGLALVAITAMAMLRIGRSRPWLLLLQPVIAVLLYFTLLPPSGEQRAGTLVIATAGATAQQVSAHRSEGLVLALPEAPQNVLFWRLQFSGGGMRHTFGGSHLVVGLARGRVQVKVAEEILRKMWSFAAAGIRGSLAWGN